MRLTVRWHTGATGRIRFLAGTAAALVLLLLWTAEGDCLPAGGGSAALYHRYTRQTQSGTPATDLNESLLRLDLFQIVPGYGRLFSSMDGSRVDDSTSLSRWQLGLDGYRLGSWTSSLIAGDSSIRFTNLEQGFTGPYISLMSVMPLSPSPFVPENSRFINATYPDIYFRGGSLHSSSSRDNLTLFGGTLATLGGFQSNEYTATDQSVYGLTWAHRWTDDFHSGIGIARTSNQPLLDGNRTLSIDNTILLVDGSYRLNSAVKFIGEYKENLFRRDGGTVNDRSFRIGPVVTLGRFRAEANYRRTGPDFVSFRDNLQPERDLDGFFGAAEYQSNDTLTFYSSIDWNRNNLGGDSRYPEVNSLSALIGGYFYHPLYPSLSLRFSFSDRSSRGSSTTAVDNQLFSAYLETTRQFRYATPYLRLLGEVTSDAVSPENSARTGSVVAGVRANPAHLLTLYLEGEEKIRNTDSGATTGSFRARGGLSLQLLQRLGIYVDSEYSSTRDKPAGTRLETVSISSGTNLALPDQYYLSGDIRFSSNRSVGTIGSESSILQLTVGLIKRFGWGTQPMALLPGQSGPLASVEVGTISGDIFQDLNQNGIRDPGEPGVAGVTVLLENGMSSTSDGAGQYRFASVPTGIHLVSINEKVLPASFNLLSQPTRRVDLGIRETLRIDYPLITASAIRGRVIIDTNGNGSADAGDSPLPDMLVYLADTKINTFSDSDGNFALENLLPGSYTVRLDTTWLPADMKPASPDSITLELKSGQEARTAVFLVSQGKREVIRKVFGKGSSTAPAPAAPP